MYADECLSGTADSILIRKSRLRRIISGGKLHSSESGDLKGPKDDIKKIKSKHNGSGGRDIIADVGAVGVTFCYPKPQPISSWNLDDECLLDAFLILFDEVEQHTNKDSNAQFFINKFEPVVQQVKDMRINMNDFRIGKLISKGAFSSVRVVKEKSNKRLFVMKSINKFGNEVQKKLYLRDAELAVLSNHSSQWIVGFQYAFQDPEKIHFVLEYMSGGNYLNLLSGFGGKLDDHLMRFYLGELVLAVNAVHSIGFAHRNVKPENILFDSLGHLKLSGFGSASRISNEGKVSTPFPVDEANYESYGAPEILLTFGNSDFIYGIECDFWSVGVIAYQSAFGEHPFTVTSSLATYKNITTPKTKERRLEEFSKKPNVTAELKDLISGLLVGKEERLNYEAILRHPFFTTLIWDGLRNEMAVPISFEADEMDLFATEDTIAQTPTRDNASAVRPISSVSFIGFTKSPLENQRFGLDNSSVMDSSMSINDGCNFPRKDREYSKLKSELEIKTESCKEKLNEIQILQTQLQTAVGLIESKECELAASKGENKRLTMDMEQINTKRMEEKEAREQLEFKLEEGKINCNNSEINDLKEEIVVLNQALDSKDTEIRQFMAEVKELQHNAKLAENERHNSLRREEALEESFAQSYRGSISLIETRVTRNSTALEARIKDLENQLSQERLQRTREMEQREKEVRDLIQGKTDQVYELQGRMEETRLSREASLEEVRQTRKKYGETIGQLQNSLDRAIEDYLEMKEKFENEHDPTHLIKIESLEKVVERLQEQNANLRLQLNECEKTKLAEARKSQQLDDIVRQLSDSVQSLQQQKTEIFESTKEYLRQNQNSEALKGAQKLLEEQLTKLQDTLDSCKEALFEEKQKTKDLSISVQSSKKEVDDYQRVIRVLTEEKEKIEIDLKNQSKHCKQVDLTLSTLESEIKELKKTDAKQSTAIESLEYQVAEEQKDLEEIQKLLAETKAEKDRLETEKAELMQQLQEMIQLKSSLCDLESAITKKDFEIQEKIQETEASNMKTDLLKESCTVLENQLKRLESILNSKNEELDAALKKSSYLTEKLKTTEELTREAKIAASEAKSLQIFAEKQLLSSKSQKNSESESKTHLISQLQEKTEELRKKFDEKLTEVNALSGKLEQLKEEKSFMECMHEELKRKQNVQSLEISRYLNSIVNMKEIMINLKTDVHEESQKAEFFRERAKILIEEKQLVEMDKAQRETELQATINQQVKLIQFFQTQAQQLSTKKKKFRFFSREKENELPQFPEELQASGSGTSTMSPMSAFIPRTPVSVTKYQGRTPLDPKSIRKFQYEEDDTDDEPMSSNTSFSET